MPLLSIDQRQMSNLCWPGLEPILCVHPCWWNQFKPKISFSFRFRRISLVPSFTFTCSCGFPRCFLCKVKARLFCYFETKKNPVLLLDFGHKILVIKLNDTKMMFILFWKVLKAVDFSNIYKKLPYGHGIRKNKVQNCLLSYCFKQNTRWVYVQTCYSLRDWKGI